VAGVASAARSRRRSRCTSTTITRRARSEVCFGQFHDDPELLQRAITYVDGALLPLADDLEWQGLVTDRAKELREAPV
jgi:hypothetical protein